MLGKIWAAIVFTLAYAFGYGMIAVGVIALGYAIYTQPIAIPLLFLSAAALVGGLIGRFPGGEKVNYLIAAAGLLLFLGDTFCWLISRG
jgi:hypothetical protein